MFADDGPKIAGIAYALYERLQKSQPKARAGPAWMHCRFPTRVIRSPRYSLAQAPR